MTSVTTLQQFEKLSTNGLCKWLQEKVPKIDTSKVLINEETGAGFSGSLSLDFDYMIHTLKEFGWSRGNCRTIWGDYYRLKDEPTEEPLDTTVSIETTVEPKEIELSRYSISTDDGNMKEIIQSINNHVPLIVAVRKYLKEMEDRKIVVKIRVFQDNLKNCFFVCSPSEAVVHIFKGVGYYAISISDGYNKFCKWCLGNSNSIITVKPCPVLKNVYRYLHYYCDVGIRGTCDFNTGTHVSHLLGKEEVLADCTPIENIELNTAHPEIKKDEPNGTELSRYPIGKDLESLRFHIMSINNKVPLINVVMKYLKEMEQKKIDVKVEVFCQNGQKCFFVCSPMAAVVHVFRTGEGLFVIHVSNGSDKFLKWTCGYTNRIVTISPHPTAKNGYGFYEYFSDIGSTGFCNFDNGTICSFGMRKEKILELCTPIENIETKPAENINKLESIKYSINYPQYLDYLKYRAMTINKSEGSSKGFIQRFSGLMKADIELKVKEPESPKILLVASDDLEIEIERFASSNHHQFSIIRGDKKYNMLITDEAGLVIISSSLNKEYLNMITCYFWNGDRFNATNVFLS